MKLIIIGVVALLLLGLGTVGGLAMFGMGPAAGLLKTLDLTPKPKPEPEPPKNRVFDMGSYMVPFIQAHAIRKEVALDLSIEVAPKFGSKVDDAMPRLRNAFLVELYDVVSHHADAHSEADRQAIRERLTKVGDRMFGEGAILKVTIRGMYER